MRPIALVTLATLALSTACTTPARKPAHPAHESAHAAHESAHAAHEPAHSAHEPAHPAHEPAHPDRSPVLAEHAWLNQFVGEWRSEAEMPGQPGEPPQKLEGIERTRSIGELWIVSEIRGGTPAGEMEAVMTLGWDAERKRYIGTWIDSMMGHMWIYEGSVDPAGRVLTLESKGPSFAGDGTLATYRDVFEFESPDRKVLRSSVLGPDGQWTQYMTARYQRTK